MSGGPPPPSIGAPAAPVRPEEAAAVAAEHWGVRGRLRRLPSERDQNFLVAGDDHRYVLKLAHPDEDPALLAAQNRVMARLAGVAPGLAQDAIPTLAGERMVGVPIAGGTRVARLLTYLPGRPVADVRTLATRRLLCSAGRAIARIDQALAGCDEAALHRDFHWDLEHAPRIVADTLGEIEDPQMQASLSRVLDTFEAEVAPRLPALRRGLIHGDANEYNLLAAGGARETQLITVEPEVTGVLDLGDMVWSRVVYDPAITAAYATARADDPLAAVIDVVAGYHETHPLTDDELAVLYPLACLRLGHSICVATIQQRQDPENRYLAISQGWIRRVLPAALAAPPRLAHYSLRAACGLPATARGAAVNQWVASTARAVVDLPDGVAWQALDLTPGSAALGPAGGAADGPDQCGLAGLPRAGRWSLGLHDEPRLLPVAPDDPLPATIHLGADLLIPSGTSVCAPLDATVTDVAIARDTAVVALSHPTPYGRVWTVLRGLDARRLDHLAPGTALRRGETVGRTAGAPLHVQLALDDLGLGTRLPGLVPAQQREAWRAICPNPGPLVGVPPRALTAPARTKADTLRRRRALIAPSLSISYADPLKIVRGDGPYLIDETGRRYLDCVNNVAHVGHSNPRVVTALSEQAAVLNTNTRYLHDTLVDYAEALVDRLPEPLSVCFLMCSGSEANDLALRIARTVTGRADVITLDGAYHGNSGADIEVSPYKYSGPGGGGRPAHVHEAPMPDPYRGRHRGFTPEAGRLYGEDLDAIVRSLAQRGRAPAAFICEPLMSCAGQIEPPPTFLEHAFAAVRRAGGLCIADEVQVGFGRLGDAFWGFETQNVVPDLVTLGKPIGNGHPLAAVITTTEIADAFANGMEYMSTFGGNPVACAVGLAVLREIDTLKLRQNARDVGTHLLGELRELSGASPFIGECRGHGLFLGIELVRDRETREPAPEIADYLVNRARSHGVLLSTDGPDHNVIKIKPPLVFTRDHADVLVKRLRQTLAELA